MEIWICCFSIFWKCRVFVKNNCIVGVFCIINCYFNAFIRLSVVFCIYEEILKICFHIFGKMSRSVSNFRTECFFESFCDLRDLWSAIIWGLISNQNLMCFRVSFLHTLFSLFFRCSSKTVDFGTPFKIQWVPKWHPKSTQSAKRAKKNRPSSFWGGVLE